MSAIFQAKALFDFKAESDAELNLTTGDIIKVFNADGEEWWEGEVNGKRGMFPKTYVEKIEAPVGAPAPPAAAKPKPKPQPNADAAVNVEEKKAQPKAERKAGPIDAKPKGAGSGGPKDDGKPKRPTSRIGKYGSNMALTSALSMFTLGIPCFFYPTGTDTVVGIYSLAVALGIYVYETKFGLYRGPSRFPARGLFYLVMSFVCFLSLPTILCGIFLAVTGLTNIASAIIGEEFDEDILEQKKAVKEAAGPTKDVGCCDRIIHRIIIARQQDKIGLYVFVGLYFVVNFLLYILNFTKYYDIYETTGPNLGISIYIPFAKGFGNMLNFNCTLIVVPVLRSMLRWLYNHSTEGQSCFAVCLRGILQFVPLDRSIDFHKLVAKMIVVATLGHSFCHFMNYNAVNQRVLLAKFGTWPFISGGLLCIIMLFLYAAANDNVKRGQFEVFWYSHHLFIFFFLLILLHGAGGWGPNYWKWFMGPGSLYVLERLIRYLNSLEPAVIVSVTHMKPNVFSLEIAKEGVFANGYKDGQYLFLNSPSLSYFQWHPFTISSSPHEDTVTVHIKTMGPGSWTRGLQEYLATMGPPGATYYELTRNTKNGKVKGKTTGPDGNPIVCIDGPHSAPTQHMSEYSTVMVVGAGIGVTPVAATLKTVVMHTWKFNVGACFPDNAYFYWVCAYNDIDAFKWLIRTIKDTQDEVMDMRAKNPQSMASKKFEFHIYITSVPDNATRPDIVVDDPLSFWGKPAEEKSVERVVAPFGAEQLLATMKCPPDHIQLGDIHIYKGRPQWNARFKDMAERYPANIDIGVAFCGNPMIAKDLKSMCRSWSSVPDNRFFRLHKENF